MGFDSARGSGRRQAAALGSSVGAGAVNVTHQPGLNPRSYYPKFRYVPPGCNQNSSQTSRYNPRRNVVISPIRTCPPGPSRCSAPVFLP